MSMPALEQLLAEQACRRVVLETARTVDEQDYSAFAQLFTSDGILLRPDGSRLEGRAAIEQAYAQRDQNRLTRHLVTNHGVTVHSPTRATSSCGILLWTGWHSDASGPHGRRASPDQMVGEFLDELTMTPAGWRIQHREARFILHRPQ